LTSARLSQAFRTPGFAPRVRPSTKRTLFGQLLSMSFGLALRELRRQRFSQTSGITPLSHLESRESMSRNSRPACRTSMSRTSPD
jgi:hypothetical protein